GGVTNVDVPAATSGIYVARALMHYTIPLSAETTLVTRNPLSLAPVAAVRRLELRAGKLSAIDFFDLSPVARDSHSQFANAAIVNNGAYDYASDPLGYTYGLVAEYFDRAWALRAGELLVPLDPGAPRPTWDLARARSENVELELHVSLFNRPTELR